MGRIKMAWLMNDELQDLNKDKQVQVTASFGNDMIILPAQDAVMCTGSLWGMLSDIAPAKLEQKIIEVVQDNPLLLDKMNNFMIYYNRKTNPKQLPSKDVNYFMTPYTMGHLIGDPSHASDAMSSIAKLLQWEYKIGFYSILFTGESQAQRLRYKPKDFLFESRVLEFDKPYSQKH
jgi:hypothetical protein